jgi:hypothetical protein
MIFDKDYTEDCQAIKQNRFLTRASEIHTRTVKDIKQYGTYITGYKEIDNDLVNRYVTTYMTIQQMVEYYKNGAIIAIVKQSDLGLIYEIITKYLKEWAYQLDVSLNIGDAPVGDLIILDNFAEKLFEYTRFNYKRGSILVGSIFDRQNIYTKSYKSSIKAIVDNKNILPNRKSYNEFLKGKYLELNKG